MKNDPANHIAWLEEQLASIEAAGGFAYIIGHIQPYNFTNEFGARYWTLMERYQHIVRTSMAGHTHDQYFSLINSTTNLDKWIHFTQIGPSVTTNQYENPAYALLDVDEETMLVTNIRIFAMDVEDANATGVPQWLPLIDYVQDYEMGHLSPDTLAGVVTRFTTDSDFWWKYSWDMSRHVGEFYEGDEKTFLEDSHYQGCKQTSTGDKQFYTCAEEKGYISGYGFTDIGIGKWKEIVNNKI